MIIEGSTLTGFKYKIDTECLADWRIIEPLSKLSTLEETQNEIEFILIVSDIKNVLFDDKGKALEKHIKKQNNGKVPADIMISEIMEILNSSKQLKN